MSSLQDPGAKVVDLRRWRDERERRLRAEAALAAPPPPAPEPPRVPWFTRVLVFMAGVALAALSGLLLSLLGEAEEGQGCALALAVPIVGVALFGAALMAWAVFGRQWFRRLRSLRPGRAGRSQRPRLEGGLVEGEVGRRRAEHREDPP